MNPDDHDSRPAPEFRTRLVPADATSASAPPLPDHLLWAYAFGKLDEEDDQKILAGLARSQTERTRLERLRQAVAATALRLREGVLAPEGVPPRLLQALARAGKTVAAGFVRVGEDLEAFAREAFWTLASGAPPLSATLDGTASASEATRQQEVLHRDGTRILVTGVPGAGVSISVRIPPGGPPGIVKLRRLNLEDDALAGEDWDSRRLDHDACEFSDCPPGVLELITPGGKSVVLYVAERLGETGT